MVATPDFDRKASAYASRARVQQRAAAWLAEWLPRESAAPALELGAGTGFFTRHALQTVAQLTATDASPQMIEAGRRDVPEASWVLAEAANPPAAPTPYRSIFSSSLVQWLPDPVGTFREWHRVAAPDASLLAGWFVRGTMDKFFEVCPDGAPFVWRAPSEWLALLEDGGWKMVRSEIRCFELSHASSAAMLRDIHDVGAAVPGRLGPGRLRAALRRHDLESRDGQGVVTPFVFLRVEAARR